MSGLGDDFRKRAAENNATAEKLFSAAEFATDRKAQAAAVIAKVTANMLSIMGELVDYLRESETVEDSALRRKRIADRADAIRKAFVAGATSGDFTNYDRLVDEFAESLGGGESGGD